MDKLKNVFQPGSGIICTNHIPWPSLVDIGLSITYVMAIKFSRTLRNKNLLDSFRYGHGQCSYSRRLQFNFKLEEVSMI
jgi:hypothetical protein